MSQKDEYESYIDFLISLGVIKEVGKDPHDGQILYNFSDDAEDFIPGVGAMQMQELNSSIFELWKMELIDVAFDRNGEPLVALNENSISKEKIKNINDPELERTLRMIVWAFADKFNN